MTSAAMMAQFTEERRFEMAARVQHAQDFLLPDLDFFNSGPCRQHEALQQGCRQCGIVFRQHQRVGIAWLYLIRKGLIADTVGSGKTGIAAGLLALLKQYDELEASRALIIVRSGSPLMQWQHELQRLVPALNLAVSVGSRKERVERYLSPWSVMLIGYHMFQRDMPDLLHFPINTLIVDDVDPLRHRDSKTAYGIKRMARQCDRVAILSGTPLQKRLHELHSVLEPIGGREIFGSEEFFRRRYVKEQKVTIPIGRLPTGQLRTREVSKVVGYQNIDEFSELVKPLALRRTAVDITDVTLPAVAPQDIYLELYPQQRDRYRELKTGVLRIIKEEGQKVKQTKAGALFNYGAMICSGLASLGEPDRPSSSIKLDWLTDKLIEGDLSDEKVVVFINYKNNIRVMRDRLTSAGVGHVIIWGEERDPAVRFAAQERFWHDPDCRVLMGTTAIEQSLNLQIARHLINVDTILNAARMTQLSGRIRRDGSKYSTVYVHNLLTSGTQEEFYMPLLEREQALQDAVWNEQSELFQALSPLALLTLIGKSTA